MAPQRDADLPQRQKLSLKEQLCNRVDATPRLWRANLWRTKGRSIRKRRNNDNLTLKLATKLFLEPKLSELWNGPKFGYILARRFCGGRWRGWCWCDVFGRPRWNAEAPTAEDLAASAAIANEVAEPTRISQSFSWLANLTDIWTAKH